jgi:hypothetical protein
MYFSGFSSSSASTPASKGSSSKGLSEGSYALGSGISSEELSSGIEEPISLASGSGDGSSSFNLYLVSAMLFFLNYLHL